MNSLQRYESQLPATTHPRELELMPVEVSARNARHAVRGDARFALKEDPSAPAERVAKMTMECAGLVDKLLGARDNLHMSLAGLGDLEVTRHGYSSLITLTREMTTETYFINELGQVMSTFTERPTDTDGAGRIGKPAEGAKLYGALKSALAQLNTVAN